MEPITIAFVALALAIIVMGALFFGRHPRHAPNDRIVASGSLLVTDSGNVVIDEPLPLRPGILEDPERYIVVEFDPCEPAPPPCSGSDDVDELDWELTFQHRHDDADLLRLKITWSVSTARTIIWRMFEPVRRGR